MSKFRNSCLLNFVAGLTFTSVVALREEKYTFASLQSFVSGKATDKTSSSPGKAYFHPLNV